MFVKTFMLFHLKSNNVNKSNKSFSEKYEMKK